MTQPASPLWEGARDLAGQLVRAGHEARFAGGCVRDLLLGIEPKDIDIATSAHPDQVQQIFPQARWVGRAFGVCVVPYQGETYEIATYRKDLGYRDGRHPTEVVFTTDREDALRRDFTINGMFFDPATESVIDYVGGQADLQAKIVRAIGEPGERFREDSLRLIRGIRFSSVLNFTLDPATQEAIRTHAGLITMVSPERIQTELTRLLTESSSAGEGFRLLDRTELLSRLLPEISALKGVEQPPEFHPEGDVFTHTMMMLNRMEAPSKVLAWAVLLHDIGKPGTYRIGPDKKGGERIRFDGHDEWGATLAEAILSRLKFSRKDTEDIVYCVRHHMRFINVPHMRPAKLRRMIGHPCFETLLELHRLDCLASFGGLDTYHLVQKVQAELANQPVLPPRWITGRDLIALGMKPGPQIGHWLELAYEAQLENRYPDRDTLLAWLARAVATGTEPHPQA